MTDSLLDSSTIETVRRGGLVIYPTETLYGLGCIATNEGAVRRLFEVKGRELGKPPPVLVAGEEQLRTLVEELPEVAVELIRTYWPGALTIVLRARPGLSTLLTGMAADGSRTIAVRRSAHSVAQALCRETGAPIVATSANPSGATGRAAMPHSLEDIPLSLRRAVNIILDGGTVAGQPSTIIDCSSSVPRILRQGAIQLEQFASDAVF